MKSRDGKYIIIIWILLLIIISLFWKQLILNDEEWVFDSIKNYNIPSTESVVLNKINTDFVEILSKYFWKIKLDKHMILKDNDSFHLFYFSKKVPNLNSVIDYVLPEIQKKWYIEQSNIDSRTFEYIINIDNNKYSIIFNVLSYHLEDEEEDDNENMWIFMLYIKEI